MEYNFHARWFVSSPRSCLFTRRQFVDHGCQQYSRTKSASNADSDGDAKHTPPDRGIHAKCDQRTSAVGGSIYRSIERHYKPPSVEFWRWFDQRSTKSVTHIHRTWTIQRHTYGRRSRWYIQRDASDQCAKPEPARRRFHPKCDLWYRPLPDSVHGSVVGRTNHGVALEL